MTKPYQLVATPVFKQSLKRLRQFLASHQGGDFAASNQCALQEKIARILPTQPRLAPVSERLAALGVVGYRQWFVDGHNVIFYRLDEAGERIILLLVMDSRQDIQTLLYDLLVLA